MDSSLFKYLETKAPPAFIFFVAIFFLIAVIAPLLMRLNKRFHVRILTSHKVKIFWCILAYIVILLSFGIKYILWGYTKEFKLVVTDKNNNIVKDFMLSLNGNETSYNKCNPSVKINSKQLYASVKVESKALTKSVNIDNNAFVDSNTISLPLTENNKIYQCVKGNNEFTIAYVRYAIADAGGIDLRTPSNSKHNYLLFKPIKVLNKDSYEISVNSVICEKDASLLLEIGGAVMILVGEGTMKHVEIKVNKTKRHDDWVSVKKYELEQPIDSKEPIVLSVTLKKISETSIKLFTTVYHGKIDEKNEMIIIDNVFISELSGVKAGCFSNIKEINTLVRLINVNMITNKI